MRNIIFAAQYAAPYEGNFIKSLRTLAQKLEARGGYKVSYIFPEAAKRQAWMPEFRNCNQVYFTVDDVRSSIALVQLREIISKLNPILIHTHFDGYDLSMRKAGAQCPIVWHLHNWLSFMPNLLKAVYQRLGFYLHYGRGSRKDIYAISVCQEMIDFIVRFGFKRQHAVCIPNGIDLSRITPPFSHVIHNLANKGWDKRAAYSFLAFGGRNISKRIDLFYKAGERLYKEGVTDFVCYVTIGTDTCETVKVLGGEQPWFKLIPQNDDINQIFAQADCFVSTSTCETFSYAIAEASYYGLPIIQSDIPGTSWNRPSQTTLWFESENVEDLARQMKRMMEVTPASLAHALQQASEGIQQNYSLDSWADKVISSYNTFGIRM